MKNWKQSIFFGMVAIIALIFGFIGCDDGNGNDDPKDQSQPITLTFGETSPTATVKGHLTDTEWNGVADKIKNAINGNYGFYGEVVEGIYKEMFGNGITIIVEKTSAYTNWKTTTDGKTMYRNFGILDSNLQLSIHGALQKMYSNEASNS
jgi:hypothetical protein